MFNNSLQWLRTWVSLRHWQRKSGLLGYAILLGSIGGVVASLFKWSLVFFQEHLLRDFAGFPLFLSGQGTLPAELFFLIPALGGLISGLLVYRFAPDAAGAGTDALIDAFHNKGGFISLRTAIVKFFASVVTLGSGGSAGQEGPMAQIGGGIGSSVGRFFRVQGHAQRILMLTGTAAGLGAIFHAPLGGALTAAEIVYKEDFESKGFLPFTVASVVAFAVFAVLTGHQGAYLPFPEMPFNSFGELIFYALLGLLCVPVSWAFVNVLSWVHRYFKGLRIPAYIKPAIGGLLVGGIAYLVPQAIGADWGALQQAVQGTIAIQILLAIVVFKILATALTIGSGGSGGVFGPSLFIGGMLGGVWGFGLEHLMPHWISSPSSFILVGMGAFFAGAAKAPLAGIIMVCEITGNYALLAPLLIATTVHITLSKKWSLYVNQKENKFASPAHRKDLVIDQFRGVPVASVLETNQMVISISAEQNLQLSWPELVSAEQSIFPVLNEEKILIGLISKGILAEAVQENTSQSKILPMDIMLGPTAILVQMDLHEALEIFVDSEHQQLPVCDALGNVLGIMTTLDLLDLYHQKVHRRTQSIPII